MRCGRRRGADGADVTWTIGLLDERMGRRRWKGRGLGGSVDGWTGGRGWNKCR